MTVFSLTIIIDDAGYGDLLYGAVIGAYRTETKEFQYDLIDVKYFQKPLFQTKKYQEEAKRISLSLVRRMKLKDTEKIELCQGDILDKASEALNKKYGEERIARIKVEGIAQHLTEEAYLDELRNQGYKPLPDRTEKWGKSFWHMYRWIKNNQNMLKYTKSGWPRLKRYQLFQSSE